MKKAFKKIALRITSLIFGLNIGLAQAPEADVSAAGFPADEDTLTFFKSIIQNHEVASMAYVCLPQIGFQIIGKTIERKGMLNSQIVLHN